MNKIKPAFQNSALVGEKVIALVLFLQNASTLTSEMLSHKGHSPEVSVLSPDNLLDFTKESGYFPFEFHVNRYQNEIENLISSEKENQLSSGVINDKALSFWSNLVSVTLDIVKKVITQ